MHSTWHGICIPGIPDNRRCYEVYSDDRCYTSLVSYGGSSLMSTILMLAIIQGLYILREDEDEEFEKRRKEAAKRIRERAKAQRAGDF